MNSELPHLHVPEKQPEKQPEKHSEEQPEEQPVGHHEPELISSPRTSNRQSEVELSALQLDIQPNTAPPSAPSTLPLEVGELFSFAAAELVATTEPARVETDGLSSCDGSPRDKTLSKSLFSLHHFILIINKYACS